MNRKSFLKFSLFLFLTFITNMWAKSNKELKINKIEILDSEIFIYFDDVILDSDVKSIEVNDKKRGNYKRIIDLSAQLAIEPILQNHNLIKQIRISQFQSNVVRIVLSDDKEMNLKYDFSESIFKIALDKAPQIASISRKINTKGKIVVIDAGHGGKDSGAVADRKLEKVCVLDIALKTRAELKAKGYQVYLTRENDNFIDLQNRTKLANKQRADIFISIHANAVPRGQSTSLNGIETYFLSPARSEKAKRIAALENKQTLKDVNQFSQNVLLNVLNHRRIIESNKLAIDVQRYMLSSLKDKFKQITDGGVREAPFWVLVGAQMPAVLIEVGYITNANDRKMLFSDTYQSQLARGIADGVEGYFIKNS